MIWAAVLSSEVFFGYEVCSLLIGEKYDFLSMLSIAIPLGIASSSMLFFVCSIILGFTSFHLYIHMGGLIAIGYIIFMRKIIKKKFNIPKFTQTEIIFGSIALFTAVSIIVSGYGFKPRVYLESGGPDIQEELAIMNSFYHGVNSGLVNIFKIRHPFCYKCVARTKWLTAMHSAMLKIGYASTKMALVAPSILYMFSFCYILLNVANIYLDSIFCSILVLPLVFFGGGYGFYYWTKRQNRNNKTLDFVFNYGETTTQWSHPIFYYILAYRYTQLSLSIASIVIFLILKIYKKKMYRKEFTLLGLLIGALPGVEIQTCIASLIFFGLQILFNLPKDKKSTKEFTISITFFGIAHLLMTNFQIFHYFPRKTNSKLFYLASFSQNLYGTPCQFPVITTWFRCLGILVFVVLIFGWFLHRGATKNIFISAVLLFAIGNYVSFSPVSRMNILFFYPYSMVIFFVTFVDVMKYISDLPKEEESKGVLIGIFIFVYLASIGSGLLGFKRLIGSKKEMYGSDSEKAAEWIVQNTPKKALFGCEENDFNVVSSLSGKVLYSGNDRLNYLAGFVDIGMRKESRQLLSNPESTEFAAKMEYAVNVGGFSQPWYINDGIGNWTLEKEIGQYHIFKRNLKR
ncbi:hypothetical protein TVAG_477010 [Trichomonas vaginalis G3]|uniref:Uncharacterized protein n=1 Tax=Trichomonas vaginalis (strain ATCC PRA-98 / G3) TaxID=412133 RepID=A2DAC4_TRIV3|nr:hypothetical protein TVAGG3_0267150 [Trichomonas vaginalis G3]EAY22772.1 hypothetical protein TVAG_477010 [Trichomonas vaginalis G3]KAI5525583.1 hypothetical protein TVAGG3_0267150 [Trichomonas vaginalis G3]|eukprot:XP_001583758.1 hypothetical protein [Trichomonas vaginalis G3]